MTLIKFCSEECLFIYIDKNLKIYCMHCQFERKKNFDGLVHFRIFIAHIKKVLEIAAKFAKDFCKLYGLNYAKPNKFLDLCYIRLNRQLELLNNHDEETLRQNLYKLINDYREYLQDIIIIKNTISSNFLQNIFQYFCIHFMKYIREDTQNSQNLNKNQKFVIIQLYGSYLDNNQNYIDLRGNSLINTNCFFATVKIFLKEFYGFQGNIIEFKEIYIFYILLQSQRSVLHYLNKNKLRRQDILYRLTDHNKQQQREILHENRVHLEQNLIQYGRLKETNKSQNLELKNYNDSQLIKLQTVCQPQKGIYFNINFDKRCFENPFLVYIDINLPTLFENSNQCSDSAHSIYFLSIREDI